MEGENLKKRLNYGYTFWGVINQDGGSENIFVAFRLMQVTIK
jgi:hypothetical protein